MKQLRKYWAVAIVVIAILTLASLNLVMGPVAADVQAAIITPVGGVARGSDARVATFFDGAALAADTRACFELMDYEVIDLQYVIDQGTVNTVTLTLQNSNNNTTFNDANVVVSANAADATGMSQLPLFGRWNCIFADVANTNPVTVTAIGVAK